MTPRKRSPSDFRGAKILIIDDEPANVLLLERLLQKSGFTAVWSTTNSGQARELYRQITPDLVLLDVHMPHPDGFAVLAQIREETPEDEYVPVVLLTADIQSHVKLEALGQGAKDFLTRPLDLGEVMLRITALLESRFLFRELERKAARAGMLESWRLEQGAELAAVTVHFHCKSCGGVHPAPVQFATRDEMSRTHLNANNIFRCPVKKLSARYSKESLIWKGDEQATRLPERDEDPPGPAAKVNPEDTDAPPTSE